jgi:hypothetical protein
MGPNDFDTDDTAETINREQQDGDQAQDVADDARLPHDGHESLRGGSDNPAQILPDDVPDLVETMTAMVRSGHIDNAAFAGEPMHDDEDSMLGDTEADGDDPLEGLTELTDAEARVTGYSVPHEREDDALYNPLADGSEDPLADLPDLDPEEVDEVADTGENPLAGVASERGDEHGLDPDDLEDEDLEDDELDEEDPDEEAPGTR